MLLTKVTICNIFSIGLVEFDVPKGITLVNGHSYDENDPNGSGKSSLAHKAITWGLFGQTAIGAKADKVKRKGAKDASVRIQYIGIDGHSYAIFRSRNPNRLSLYKDINSDTELEITQSTEKATQELINQSLGRDFTSWLQTDFFGQGRKQSYAELTPAQQKAVLEEILPMDQLDDWANSTSKSLDKIKEKIQQVQIDKTTFENARNMFRRQKEEMSTRVTNWDSTQKSTIQSLFNTVSSYMKIMEGLDTSLSTVNTKIEQAERAEEKLAELKIAQKLLEADKQQNHEEIKEALRREEEWREHKTILQGKIVDDSTPFCVTCGTKFSLEKLKETKQRNNEIQQQLNVAEEHLRQATKIVKVKEAEREDYWDKATQLEVFINVNAQTVRGLPDLLAAKRHHEKEIESSDLHSIQARLEEAKAEINPYREMFGRASIDYNAEVSKLAKAEREMEELLSEQKRLEYWKGAFKEGLKIHLFESVIGFLNERANHYIAALGNGQIHIEFSSYKRLASGEAKEAFNVNVYSDTGGGEYGLLSGGEQQMTSFAIGLALADLAASKSSGNADFMVLDEPFTNLGPTNCERLIQFLTTELAKTKSTILIISNEDHLKDLVPNQLRVIKQNGITSLEE